MSGKSMERTLSERTTLADADDRRSTPPKAKGLPAKHWLGLSVHASWRRLRGRQQISQRGPYPGAGGQRIGIIQTQLNLDATGLRPRLQRSAAEIPGQTG